MSLIRHPATAKWYDRRDCVFIEFLVEDSKDVNVNFEKSKFGFSCLSGTDNMKYSNEIDLFESIDQDGSKHRRTDRSILCCLQKAESGKSWPRLTKDKAKLNWLSVDFNNWKDWEDDSDEDLGNYDRFSEMMGNMGGEDDLPDLDGADDESADSDDEKMPDLE
ncbi:prostaglandin E synthase 3b isoform X1 [Carassius auratus]|uniref:Prostaglandin E synthase 3 n=1 Tax=Carassius auratus TaxID=7957 RepID=A0A6P6J4M7_CARAU|nr:prostaglandin E synthase 3-like isoform X1 [Carassius auratus]XP_052450924.1 prostaglandin E synthase 3 isoform X1 [Carassius gibelio]